LGAHLARQALLPQDAPWTVVLVAGRAFHLPVVAQERQLGLKMEPQGVLLPEWQAAKPLGPRDE